MTALLEEQTDHFTEERRNADKDMLAWLRRMSEQYKEDGYARKMARQVVGRVAELVESEQTIRRVHTAVQDAQKLAMAQLQFSQQALRQLEKQMEALQLEHRTEGNGKSAKNIDQKGK